MSGQTNPQTEELNAEAAAKQAADEAIQQAREASAQVATAVKTLDPMRLSYLVAMSVVVLTTLVFDMTSFAIGTDYAVSETVAQAQRDLQARMNSWAYSAFGSTMWGKLMWLSAVAGIGILIYGAVKNSRAAWVPLGQIGCAAVTTVLLLLLLAVGFPDLSEYHDASVSATLLGYWVPLAAAGTATACSVRRLLGA